MENDGRTELDGHQEASSCPEEDRSWKRRSKRTNSGDVESRNKNNGDLGTDSLKDRKPIRERLGRLDSQGNHLIRSKPRYL